jgi:hypothetical protein
LNAPFIALSAADPSGGIMPIWRAYWSWSTTTKFETTLPSRTTKWSMPSIASALPVGAMPSVAA